MICVEKLIANYKIWIICNHFRNTIKKKNFFFLHLLSIQIFENIFAFKNLEIENSKNSNILKIIKIVSKKSLKIF